jgi:hypothetical protein
MGLRLCLTVQYAPYTCRRGQLKLANILPTPKLSRQIPTHTLKYAVNDLEATTMSSQSKSLDRRVFIPLNPEKALDHEAPRLEGIVFDVDGTLCKIICIS